MKKASLILLVTALVFNTLNAQDFIFTTTIDLNSDNKTEIVKVEITDNPYEFRLLIEKKEVLGKFNDGDTDGFKVIDINTHDNYREIAVHTPGSSSDDEYMIYWYDGKDIIFMDHLSRWPTFNGNGIVYLNNWEDFWSSRDKYVLNNSDRKLKKIEQFAYYVGITVKVKKGFVIYKEKDLSNKVALLSEGSEIMLILCDKTNKEYFNYKYLIKSKSGLLGWSDFKQIQENTEGIQTAD